MTPGLADPDIKQATLCMTTHRQPSMINLTNTSKTTGSLR
jgi:hypothetical protein